MAIIKPGSMSASAEAEARAGITTADADYNHSADNATDCAGWAAVLVRAEKTAGGNASSTITVEPAVLMGDTFVKVLDTTPVAIKSGEAMLFAVHGRKVFWHVSALTAGTTWTLHVGGANPMRPDAPRRD